PVARKRDRRKVVGAPYGPQRHERAVSDGSREFLRRHTLRQSQGDVRPTTLEISLLTVKARNCLRSLHRRHSGEHDSILFDVARNTCYTDLWRIYVESRQSYGNRSAYLRADGVNRAC